MTAFLGIDLGAGSMKVSVVSKEANVIGDASAPVTTSSPHLGWAEQNPKEWRKAMITAIPKALKNASVAASDVEAISFSAGAHSFVLEDNKGQILRPAIMWMDQRSALIAESMKASSFDLIYKKALNVPSATWTLPQLAWLSRYEPEIVKNVAKVFLAKDWLRHQLSRDWNTDLTDAIGTMLYDFSNKKWSQKICSLADWDVETLPPVVQAVTVTGQTCKGYCEDFSLPPGIPIVCGTSDTSVETLAGGGVKLGDATVKLATAGTVSVINNCPAPNPSLINYPYVIPDLWYNIAGTNSCASAHRWYCDLLYGNGDSGDLLDMDSEVALSPVGAKGLLFHPYLRGERAPYYEPRLRADFIGLTFEHSRKDLSRAIYEGISFSLRDVMTDFKANGISFDAARIIGGGAKSEAWRQIVADVLDIVIIEAVEADASFGAAIVAGVATGYFPSAADAIGCRIGEQKIYDPNPKNRQMYDDMFGIYRDAQAALKPINIRLHEFQERQV